MSKGPVQDFKWSRVKSNLPLGHDRPIGKHLDRKWIRVSRDNSFKVTLISNELTDDVVNGVITSDNTYASWSSSSKSMIEVDFHNQEVFVSSGFVLAIDENNKLYKLNDTYTAWSFHSALANNYKLWYKGIRAVPTDKSLYAFVDDVYINGEFANSAILKYNTETEDWTYHRRLNRCRDGRRIADVYVRHWGGFLVIDRENPAGLTEFCNIYI
jgi:hypothetical protein